MPRLSCRDLGGDCPYFVSGRTAEDVKRELLSHVATAHRDRLSRMTQDEREALDVRIEQVLRNR